MFLLALSVLPVAILLNRLPAFAIARVDGDGRRVVSSGIIVTAFLTMVALLIAGGLVLEATACSIGVPNCD